MAMNTFGSDKQILYSGCLLDANLALPRNREF